jgi:hypothetical protein
MRRPAAVDAAAARPADGQAKIEKAIARALGDDPAAFIGSAQVCDELAHPSWVNRFNYPPKLQPPAAPAA